MHVKSARHAGVLVPVAVAALLLLLRLLLHALADDAAQQQRPGRPGGHADPAVRGGARRCSRSQRLLDTRPRPRPGRSASRRRFVPSSSYSVAAAFSDVISSHNRFSHRGRILSTSWYRSAAASRSPGNRAMLLDDGYFPAPAVRTRSSIGGSSSM